MSKYYVLRCGDSEPSIDGPYTAEEMARRLDADYAGCKPPKFCDAMPSGSLMYGGDRLTVFRAEVVVPSIAESVKHWTVP
jgi:hypothetical protein